MDKLLKVIKIMALLSALIFLVIFWSVNKTNCDACSFGVDKFMNSFYDKCIPENIGLNITNLPISIPNNA